MKKISIAFLAAMSLVASGCRKDKGGESNAKALAKMTELRDKMCACKDKACSEKVSEEYTIWSQEQAKPNGDKQASPGEEDKKMEEVTEELTQCLLKLEVPTGGGAAGTTGAAGAAGGASGTMGSGSPVAGSADGAAATGSAGGAAAAGSAH